MAPHLVRTVHMLRLASRSLPRAARGVLSCGAVALLACTDRPGPAEPPRPTAAPALQAAGATPPGPAERDHYLVRLRDDAPGARGEAQRLARAHGGQVGYVYERALHGFTLRLPAAAAAAIARDSRVQSIRPVQAMHLADVQTSPPWGLDRIDQATLPLDGTFQYAGTGWNYTAYVFDSGIRTTHVEFEGRATTGFTVPDGAGGIDCHGHGTHVAGTIGGASFGVAKQAQIVSVRVFGYGDCSGSDADLLAGIDWVLANQQLPAVANMSLGFGQVVPEVDAAVSDLIASGVAVVVAAGNSGVDACTDSPARVPDALTVAASDRNDARSVWTIFNSSNYGSCVDLFAPGTDIVSAAHTSNTGSLSMSGTSMAAPHATGAVAYTQEPVPATGVERLIGNATLGRVSNAGSGTPNRLLNTNLTVACTEGPCEPPPQDPRFALVATDGPYTGTEGSSITVSLANPADPTLTYEWDFGDGATAAGESATHAYAGSGTYFVRLTARDVADPTLLTSRTTTATIANLPPAVNAGNDSTVVAGTPFYARASFTDPGADDGPWLFQMAWGDGTTSSVHATTRQGALSVISHTYPTPGTYTVTVTVEDKDEGAATDAAVVTVRSNEPPTAAANGPYAANEGTAIQFASAGSSDPNGQTITYAWAFGDGTTSTAANPKKTYTDDGDYTVTLTVRDASGATASSQTPASIANVAPTASFGAPSSVAEGTGYTLSLSGTDAGTADRPTLAYAFDCGQGEGFTEWSTTVKSVTCPAVPDQRSLTARGQVKDKDDSTTSYSKTVNVTNAAPVVAFKATGGTAIAPGTTLGFEGSFTDKGTEDEPWSYTIVWGDGSPNETGATPVPIAAATPLAVSHAYTKPGTWSATLAVKDKDGATGTSSRVTVTVSNDPPVAAANGPYAGNEGANVAFSSSGSSDPNGQTLTYTWNFGDGTTSSSANPSKAYKDDGAYTVTLTVRDASGATASSQTTATIANVAPTGTLSASSAVEGSGYTLTLSGTDASTVDRTTLEYAFDCGQGTGWTSWSTTKTVSCPAVPDQRALTVSGQARDKDDAVSVPYTRTVTVTNSAPVVTLAATAPTAISVGGTFSVQGSFTDRGASDDPWTYTVAWGDGVGTVTGSLPDQSTPITATHSYARSGTFYVILSVKDKDGATGTSARIAVTVSP